VLVSEYVPVAVNCWVVPFAIDGLTGVTAIDTSVAAVTVNVSGGLVTPLNAAVICDVPTAAPIAMPAEVIVATEVVPDTHVACVVKFCVLVSEYVPVAVNCSVVPFAIDGLAGVTAIDTSVAAVTVNVSAGLVTPLNAAVICDVPTATPLARPAELIVATAVAADTHVACVVRFCVLVSEYVPVAVNCSLVPLAIDGPTGVTAIDTSVAAATVNVSGGLVRPPNAAVICDVPTPMPVAKPAELIVATPVVPDTHVACVVKFCVLLSVYVPVAVNCSVVPFAIDGLAGVTAIDTSVAAVTVNVSGGLVTPLNAAVICDVPTPAPVATPAEVIVATVVVPDTHVACAVRFCVLVSV
jgi:hypothetical protein